jgi:hypothetical protein
MEGHRLIVGPIAPEGEAERAVSRFRAKGWNPDRFTSEGNSYFSFGFFYNKREAERMEGDLIQLGYPVRVRSQKVDRKVFKVISDTYPSLDLAHRAQQRMESAGFSSVVERLGPES